MNGPVVKGHEKVTCQIKTHKKNVNELMSYVPLCAHVCSCDILYVNALWRGRKFAEGVNKRKLFLPSPCPTVCSCPTFVDA